MWFMFYSFQQQEIWFPQMKKISLMQRIWCINCSLHKLWLSFCDLRVISVGKFQRDFFVEMHFILSAQTFHSEFCTEIVQINPTRKGATFHEQSWKVKMQVFSSDCPEGNLSWHFFGNLNICCIWATCHKRLLKLDV